MAFNNQQVNEKNNQNDINSRGLQLYNSEGFDPSMVSLDFWNDTMFSIRIHPALEKSKQTDKKKFDYDHSTTTALSVNKALEILAHADDIRQAFAKGEDRCFYVEISGVNLFGIGTMEANGKRVIYIAIHRNLDNNRIPSASAYYEFVPNRVIKNYDPKTGNFESSDALTGEFELFTRYLSVGIDGMTRGTAHSIRALARFYERRMESKLDTLMKANGCEYQSSNSSGGRYNRSSTTLFNHAGNGSAPVNQASESVISADALEDELPF